MSSRIRMLLSVAVFLALLLAVELLLGWRQVLTPWSQLSIWQASFAVALVLLSYAVRTLRLVGFFTAELRGQFLLALKLMLIHNLWNNLLPMRTGEISFPILMRQYFQIPASRSLPALFWFRLLDLYVVLMLAVIGMLLLRDQTFWALLAMLGLTLMIPLLYRLMPWSLQALARRLGAKPRQVLLTLQQSLPSSWRLLLVSSAWTLLNWTVKLAAFVWVMQQFAPLGSGAALLGAIGGELTSVLPIHGVAGAGTYEAGVVAALLPSGIDSRSALTAALNLHLFMLSCTLLSGVAGYLLPARKPLGK